MKQTGCYILCYYFPEFVRTATLIQALKQKADLNLYQATNRSRSWWRYWQTIFQLLLIRLRYAPDFYMLGFRGYEIFWIIRLLTWGKPLLFDHMMSPYDSLVNEKHRLLPDSWCAKIVYWYEKNILQTADLILTDTHMHKDYFAELFSVDQEKIHPVHVAADETLFRPCLKKEKIAPSVTLNVFFYGSFLPLHGIDVILESAALLLAQPVEFTLVGGYNQDLRSFHARCAKLNLTNISHTHWVEYAELPRWASQADLCLGGPFGDTGQGRRVITGKTYQFLALGQPTVVGLGDENEHFVDQRNCLLVPQGDPEALARAISWAADHRQALSEIGRQGHALYHQEFSVARLREKLESILSHVLLPT